jgi:hypothetical protein
LGFDAALAALQSALFCVHELLEMSLALSQAGLPFWLPAIAAHVRLG